MNKSGVLDASFRDPNGFLFTHDGILYRQVNKKYASNYDHLMESGLYERLIKSSRIVPHLEVNVKAPNASLAYKIIKPERIPFISYPYEWSFGQLRDAALATLSIQKRALKFGMSLKDASAYNIQFLKGKPVLIDTLSFEVYKEGEPWVAYRQFCQHFLVPLVLMNYRDVRLSQLLKNYIDGVPLDLASKLLPSRTRWHLGIASHIHLHAAAQKRFAGTAVESARHGRKMSLDALLGLIESLRGIIKKLRWNPVGTEWAEYYEGTNYSDKAFDEKKALVEKWLKKTGSKRIWDLGANTGIFSRIAAQSDTFVVSTDIDPAAVEINYRQVKENKEENILPIVLDLTNPSPAIGWNNNERDSFIHRGPADVVFALALIHHLAISNNVPLEKVAEFFSACGEWLIIEFVPKSDSQVIRLLQSREDIFDNYSRDGFEAAFNKHYAIKDQAGLTESERVLYLMKKK